MVNASNLLFRVIHVFMAANGMSNTTHIIEIVIKLGSTLLRTTSDNPFVEGRV
jgi:hypothetical protein